MEVKKNICICCTIPETFHFSDEILKSMPRNKYDITLISSNEEKLKKTAEKYCIGYKYIPFKRAISPISDLICLFKLWVHFISKRPEIVVGATPKAALLSMVASFLAFVPKRIYHIYGLTFETAIGFKLKLLLAIEKITGFFSNHILPIGTSVKNVVLSKHLYASSKISLPSLLTIGGVDTNKFNREQYKDIIVPLKKELGIPKDNLVVGYIARLTYDKGFCDLIKVWEELKKMHNLSLLIIGESDGRIPMDGTILNNFFNQSNVFHINHSSEIFKYFSLMDVFLFPSHREGFGNVNIEASAMKIPVVTYDVTGCKDAVRNGITGFTVPYGNHETLCKRTSELLENDALRKGMGNEGREFVLSNFDSKKVAQNFISYIENI